MIAIYTDASIVPAGHRVKVGFGCQIVTASGETRAGWYKNRAANKWQSNVRRAEIEAVIYALRFVSDTLAVAGERVEVYLDSQQAFDWIMKAETVSSLNTQLTEVERLVNCPIRYNWIRRDLNEVADKLAYEAILLERDYVREIEVR